VYPPFTVVVTLPAPLGIDGYNSASPARGLRQGWGYNFFSEDFEGGGQEV